MKMAKNLKKYIQKILSMVMYMYKNFIIFKMIYAM